MRRTVLRSLDKISTAFYTTTLVSKANTSSNLLTNCSIVQSQQHPTTRDVKSTVIQYHSSLGASFKNDEKVLMATSSATASTTSTLDVTRFEEWTSKQVCSLLCVPAEQGGASLTEEDVKPLLDAKFDGTSLANIVQDIKEKDKDLALTILKNQFNDAGISLSFDLSSTLKNVVDWVYDSIVEPQQRPATFEQEIQSLQEQSPSNTIDFYKYYSKAQAQLASAHQDMVLSEKEYCAFENTLFTLTKIPSKESSTNIKLGNPDHFDERYHSTPLPIFQDKMQMKIAKFQLPYFTQFHHTIETDKVLQSKLKNTKQKSAIMFMGASGVGKTSTCNRLLCNNPGMLLTCSLSWEVSSGLTTDGLMESVHSHLCYLDTYELYGCVEQVVLMSIICRLVYILKLIENAKDDPTVFEIFTQRDANGNILSGGILPYLAFMQIGSSKTDASYAFYHSLEYKYTNPEHLKEQFVVPLVGRIVDTLNNNSTLFGIKKKVEQFIAVIDEANVFARLDECDSCSELVGMNGEKKGLLTILAQLLTSIEKFHLAIYAGTNLSVNVGSIIQSVVGKSESNIELSSIYDFGLIKRKDLIPFLEKHINIPEQEKKEFLLYLKKNKYKYFRSRMVTLALEKFSKEITLKDAFILAVDIMVKDIEMIIGKEYFNETYSRKTHTFVHPDSNDMMEAIVDYVVHYTFPFLGIKFKVKIESIANDLLHSGFVGPDKYCENGSEESHYEFSAIDLIGFELGKKLIARIWNCKTETELMEKIIEKKIEMIQSSTNHNIETIDLLRQAQIKLRR